MIYARPHKVIESWYKLHKTLRLGCDLKKGNLLFKKIECQLLENGIGVHYRSPKVDLLSFKKGPKKGILRFK